MIVDKPIKNMNKNYESYLQCIGMVGGYGVKEAAAALYSRWMHTDGHINMTVLTAQVSDQSM